MDLSRIWTADTWTRSHPLYHLSYQPLTSLLLFTGRANFIVSYKIHLDIHCEIAPTLKLLISIVRVS